MSDDPEKRRAPVKSIVGARATCPQCGRFRARSANDAMAGDCPKWWAPFDKDAQADCDRVSALAAPALSEAAEITALTVATMAAKLSPEAQWAAAEIIAANVGGVVVNSPEHPDSPHASRPSPSAADAPGVGEIVHPDDIAVDRFASAMKAKLAEKRGQGYRGWDDKADCSNAHLSELLRKHVEKGDPVDVGNFAMMIHQRGERIDEPPALEPRQPFSAVVAAREQAKAELGSLRETVAKRAAERRASRQEGGDHG